jgi:hypothetical protein
MKYTGRYCSRDIEYKNTNQVTNFF